MLAALGKLMSLRKENENENFFVDQEGRLACAALMTRAAWLDGTLVEGEESALRDLMMKRFEISPEEADEILKAAMADLDKSNDLYKYTKDLRDNFDADERLKLIEMIWEVVYADGVLHDFEATLMRRLAGLLYVDDRDSGRSKKNALCISLGCMCNALCKCVGSDSDESGN